MKTLRLTLMVIAVMAIAFGATTASANTWFIKDPSSLTVGSITTSNNVTFTITMNAGYTVLDNPKATIGWIGTSSGSVAMNSVIGYPGYAGPNNTTLYAQTPVLCTGNGCSS